MPSVNRKTSEDLDREIERIATLDLEDLRLQWRNAFGKRAPTSLPRTLLVKMLAHRLQVDVFGDLAPETARVLESYAKRAATAQVAGERKETGPRSSAILNIKSGSVLSREWKGRIHRVMALETGFGWEGGTYRSLSEVARVITGTRWNGRRFFGVDRDFGAAGAEPTKPERLSASIGAGAETTSGALSTPRRRDDGGATR